MTRFASLLLARGILALIVGCVLIATVVGVQSRDRLSDESTGTVASMPAQTIALQFQASTSSAIEVTGRSGPNVRIRVNPSGALTGANVRTNPVGVRAHTEYTITMNADVRPATHGPGNPAAYVYGADGDGPGEQLGGYGYVVGSPATQAQSFTFNTGKWSRIIFVPVALNSWSWHGRDLVFSRFRITAADCQPPATQKSIPLEFAREARLVGAFLMLDGILAAWLMWQLPAFGRRRLAAIMAGLSIAFGLAFLAVPELHVTPLYPLIAGIVLIVLGVRVVMTALSAATVARMPALVIQSAIVSVALGIAYFSLAVALLASILGLAALCIAKLIRQRPDENVSVLRLVPSNDALFAGALTLLPLILLFNPFGYVREDWSAGTWLSGFYGAYLLHHGWFPNEINAAFSGDVTPLFYGFALFRLTGILSTMLHGDAALRLAVIAATFAATYEAISLLRTLTKSQILIASLTLAAVPTNYALTNLYTRGASNEFCSTMLVFAAICCWLKFGFGKAYWELPIRTGLYFSIAAGSHPITAAGGSALFALAAVTTLLLGRTSRRRQALSLCGVAVITVAIVSPWLYAVAHFSANLAVAQGPPMIAFTDFDNLTVRLWPLPLDPRHWTPTLPSPGFTAQIAVYLLVNLALIISLLIRERRLNSRVILLIAVQALFAVTVFVLSVVPAAWHVAPSITHPLFLFQSVYRLLTYVNGAIFLLCVTLLASAETPLGLGKIGRAAAATIFAFVLLNLGARMSIGAQSMANQHPLPGVSLFDAADRVAEVQADVPSDYSTPSLYGDAQPAAGGRSILFAPGSRGEGWGIAQPVVCLRLPTNTGVTTNTVPFPWNEVTINGREVTNASFTHNDQQNANLVVIKSQPGVNRFEYLFRPDPTWVLLSVFSFLAMIGIIPLSLAGVLIGGAAAERARVPDAAKDR